MADDWSDVERILAELVLLTEGGGLPAVAKYLRALSSLLNEADYAAFAERAASGSLWGHMGSLFDSSIGDQQADYYGAQRRLADALSAHQVSSHHIEHHLGRD